MIQWTGDNLAEVLAYTGHKDVVINSFGDPCVRDLGNDMFVPCAIGEWLHWHEEVLLVLRHKVAWDE